MPNANGPAELDIEVDVKDTYTFHRASLAGPRPERTWIAPLGIYESIEACSGYGALS